MNTKPFIKLFVIFTSIIVLSCNSNKIPNNWETYTTNVYSICFPPTMEIKDKYSLHEEYEKRGIKITDNQYDVIFQQKGTNVGNYTDYDHYIRVILSFIQSEKGTFAKHSEQMLTGNILAQNDDFFKNILFGIIEDNCKFPYSQSSLIEPSNKENVKYQWSEINGNKVLSTKYKRFWVEKKFNFNMKTTKNKDGSISVSHDPYEYFYKVIKDTIEGQIFIFQNDDKAIVITMSCPSYKWDYNWMEYFGLIKKSFHWDYQTLINENSTQYDI